ncbi:MAG: SprT-like domain-containing protein [Cyclobacteriaceae bacterium]|nr:SprT-like domain-containing protein [Cyclobacteriaceae bacterium]
MFIEKQYDPQDDPGRLMLEILNQHIPASYVDDCFNLWRELKFSFTLSRERTTKAGDYRYHPAKDHHHITINRTLNPYAFLITYLHEVAHMKVRLKYPGRLRHHGEEWKKEFRSLLIPVLITDQLPQGLSKALARYARSPKASTYSDHRLLAELRKYDEGSNSTLGGIQAGEDFSFNGKWYTLESKRRTRALCKSLENNRKYLISLAAVVDDKKTISDQ